MAPLGTLEMQNSALPFIEVPALTLEELKECTNNFGSEALIGEGSGGRVYYATLNSGKVMVVKKFDVYIITELKFYDFI